MAKEGRVGEGRVGGRINLILKQKTERNLKLERLRKNIAVQKMQKMHMGIRVLLEYISFLAVIGLAYVIANLIRPNIIVQSAPLIQKAEIILTVSSIFILYGLFERARWVWVFSMLWFFLVMAYSLFLHYKMLSLGIVQFEIFLLLSLFSLMMNITIICYLYLKRMYFTNIYFADTFSTADRIFVNIVLSLLVMLLAISITVFNVAKF